MQELIHKLLLHLPMVMMEISMTMKMMNMRKTGIEWDRTQTISNDQWFSRNNTLLRPPRRNPCTKTSGKPTEHVRVNERTLNIFQIL
jgi:hypothetical protein